MKQVIFHREIPLMQKNYSSYVNCFKVGGMMIMVMGLPGSGKTYFSRKLGEQLNAFYIGSDQVRRQISAMGKYKKEDKNKVYEMMQSRAKASLAEGKTVLLDATFYKNDLRLNFISLAEKLEIPFFLIWVEASEALTKKRISKKREDSEADFEVYKKIAAAFEAPSTPYLKLQSTQTNIDEMLGKAALYLSTKL